MQAIQRGRPERAAEILPIAFGSPEEATDAFAGAGLDMFDAKPAQFVAAKSAPKTEQDE
jgi:hypothetical protein